MSETDCGDLSALFSFSCLLKHVNAHFSLIQIINLFIDTVIENEAIMNALLKWFIFECLKLKLFNFIDLNLQILQF